MLNGLTSMGLFHKAKIIYVFTDGVYNVSKSVFMNKKITARADGGTANDAMEVAGPMAIDGRVGDISAEYILTLNSKELQQVG